MNIKPTGLKGGDKIQRIQNLMAKLSPLNESTTNSSLEHIKYGPDNTVYGIIRENHTYFIKTANKTNDKLTSGDFEYIGGLQNKMDESYRSYEDALRHLNMKFKDLNESYGIRENINLFKSDFLLEETKKKTTKNEQEEETTFKLKVDAPEATSTPMDTTTPDMGEVPTDDMSTDVPTDLPTDDMEMGDETDVPDDTEGDEDTGDLEKDIQRLTGKIGQKMRELDEPDAELEKYVLNSIMSALNVEDMDEDFKEDLISKLEGETEETSDETDTEEVPEEPIEGEEVPEESTDTEEVPEETPMKAEGRVISKKTLLENLKNKKSLEVKLKKTVKESDEFYGKFRDEDDDWLSNLSNKRSKISDTEDWEEEEFDDYESFSSKNPNHNNWFSGTKNPEGSKMMFNRYKDDYGPLSIRKKMIKNPNLPDDEDFLEEEETITSYKDLNDFKTNNSKLAPKSKFSVTGVEGNFMKEMNEDETIYEIELDEDSMEEGNAFTRMLSKTKKGEKFKLAGRSYTDKSNYDELDESDIEEYYSPDEDKEYPKSYYEPGTRYKSPNYDKGIDIEFNDEKATDEKEVTETRQRRFKPFQPKKK